MLLIYLDLHVPIFFCFLFYLDLHVSNFFLIVPCLSSQKGKRGIYEGDSSNFEVLVVHKTRSFNFNISIYTIPMLDSDKTR